MKNKFIVILPIALFLLSGCEMQKKIEQSTNSIWQNIYAVQSSTEVIRENKRLIEESTKVLEENQRSLEAIEKE